MREDLENNAIMPGMTGTQSLPMRVCTRREDGYNPTRVYINGMFREQFNPHPEIDPVMALFYSPANIAKIQDMCEHKGLGRPSAQGLRYYQDIILTIDRGQFNACCVPNYPQLIHEFVDNLNRNVMAMIEPYMTATKFGYEQYYRDINQMRNIPDYPVGSADGSRKNTIPLEFSYYSNLE